MDTTVQVVANAHELVARSGGALSPGQERPPVYKAVGISLAIASGVFIGISFVLKKMGLLKANEKYNEEAGEGYGYLKNAWWWTGMTLMIVGEVCNFVAYAFVDAILVTPLGALSVVITTILSAIFLKERLSFVGKVGCFNCIIGSVVIVMNAPSQSAVADIQGMKDFVVTPGFLTYTGVIVAACTFIALWVGPRYGKKSMLVYLSVCSLIGGLSVVCTQGLGAAIVAQAGGKPQFNQWFLYVVLVFVITTLLVEIIYLNKALNLFNAALVTPTYYVFFTSATIVTSAILFQGFKGTPISIATVIMGFLQICTGVVLLQMSKSAKDVPDAAVFKGDLDQVREIGEQEQPESEPKADAIRGTAALIRRISVSRQKMEAAEAQRYREEKMKDSLEPVGENEVVEWDGLRRRKTVVGDGLASPMVRRKSIHPPLGMSTFPAEDELEDHRQADRHQHGFLDTVRTRATSVLRSHRSRPTTSGSSDHSGHGHTDPVALGEMKHPTGEADTPIQPYGAGSLEEAQEHIYGLPPGLRKSSRRGGGNGQNSPRSKPLPPQPTVQSPAGAPNIPFPSPLGKSNRRQFSFQNMFRGPRSPGPSDHQSSNSNLPPSRAGIGSRSSSAEQRKAIRTATEEERLGLVKGDSHAALLDSDLHPYSEHDSEPSSTPPRPQSQDIQYPYAAPMQDSAASSPEAHTPLVPKHSYLLSSSTMSDDSPMYHDPHPPGYPSAGLSAPPPPVREEETDVDYDDWQISSRLEPHPPRQPHPPTPRFPPSPTTSATQASSPLPPPSPKAPPQTESQLPAYHTHNPYQLPVQQRHQAQRLPEPLQAKATEAAAQSDPFRSIVTSQHPNTIGGTTTRDARGMNSRSRPGSIAGGADRPTEAADDGDPASLVQIRVTSPGEQEEYEEQRRKFEARQARRKGRSRSRGGDEGGSTVADGGAAFV